MFGRASIGTPNDNDIHVGDYIDYKKEEITAHNGRDLVHINAGGTRFTTLFDTLAQSKSAYFSNFIRVDKKTGKILMLPQRTIKDESGAIFVNRDGHLFAYVLQYMRDRKMVLPKDENVLAQLKREADFFGMETFKCLIQETIQHSEHEARVRNEDLFAIRQSVNQIANNTYFNANRS